jgi:uncharacterized protein YjiS (DUF1127 family)
MSGLSDVRLVLKSEELRQVTVDQHLCAAVSTNAPTVSRWRGFWRRLTTRRALLTLSDEQLRDIGLSRAQARRAALLPFWKL